MKEQESQHDAVCCCCSFTVATINVLGEEHQNQPRPITDGRSKGRCRCSTCRPFKRSVSRLEAVSHSWATQNKDKHCYTTFSCLSKFNKHFFIPSNSPSRLHSHTPDDDCLLVILVVVGNKCMHIICEAVKWAFRENIFLNRFNIINSFALKRLAVFHTRVPVTPLRNCERQQVYWFQILMFELFHDDVNQKYWSVWVYSFNCWILKTLR